MAKSSVFKAHLKVVTVLVDRQLCGSEFQTEGERRLNDFADIMRDIRGKLTSIKQCAYMGQTDRIMDTTSTIALGMGTDW